MSIRHETSRGVKWYDSENRLHRKDDLPAVERYDGMNKWYKHGLRHRVGGPAVINKENQQWYFNGVLHRDDGPAIYIMMEHRYGTFMVNVIVKVVLL